MNEIRDWWPQLLTVVAIIAFLVRLESQNHETREWRAAHEKAVKDGFSGVNLRLDTLNGKVYRHEGEIARLIGGRS